MPPVLLPPPLTRSIWLPSPKRTRADMGVRPAVFVYVTVNVNVVVGVPLPGATPPLVNVVRPHVAVSPRTGVTSRNEDAPNHAASANAPASLTLAPRCW